LYSVYAATGSFAIQPNKVTLQQEDRVVISSSRMA